MDPPPKKEYPRGKEKRNPPRTIQNNILVPGSGAMGEVAYVGLGFWQSGRRVQLV